MLQNYFKTLFTAHNTPCFIADLHTEAILYRNPAMDTLLALDEPSQVLGKKFYNTIIDQDVPYPYQGGTWDGSKPFDHQFYEKTLEKPIYVTHTPLWFQDTCYNLCLYQTLKHSDVSRMTFEEAMTTCLSILQMDDEFTLPSFLELLGQYYKAEKNYLYHVNHVNMVVTCVTSWTKHKGVYVTEKITDKTMITGILKWLDTRNEAGILEANIKLTSQDIHPIAPLVLQVFQIENLVLSVIVDPQQQVVAVIGVANREESSADFRLLQTVTRFTGEQVSREEMKKTLQTMNHVDILTGLFSRSRYNKRVEELELHPPKQLGVVFININGLKKINGEYGYAKGDSFIKKCAKQVQDHFSGAFYRISGDEFVGFFPDMDKIPFQSLVTSLHETMKEQEDYAFAVGHAWASGRFDILQQVREADTVMYINKQEYYHQSNRGLEEISDRTLSDLLGYLENDEFLVYLQPQVNLSDGSLYGAEALIRRFDKLNQKMVFPDQFIPLYEKKSVIRHVDIFVVDKVCRLLALWGNDYQQIPISVNLSRVTLLEFGIAETIAKICDQYDIPHHLLVIEVTERVGLIENNVASTLVQEFQNLGFRISLDDFGCAYSNIVTLAQISVDEVKVDKSLVDFLVPNEKSRVLVKNILNMCNELQDTSTLAEGIEDEEQAQLLREYHCHLGQGYHYSRPIPDSEFFKKYILPTKTS